MELKEEIKEIKELLQEKSKEKEKKFNFPWRARVRGGKAKKNWVTIEKINENGHVNFKRVQITDQTFIEEGIPRLAAAGYVMFYKNNPLIILPSWSVEPFSPRVNYEKSLLDGSNAKGYQLLMARMKSSQIDQKKSMGGMLKWIIGIGLVGIIAYAFITGGGA